MNPLLTGISEALSLIAGLDRTLLEIISLSLTVSGLALLIASAAGLPLGAVVALKRFPLRSSVITMMNTFTGLPPVVAGLFLYIILSRSGPLGFMGLLYSPSAMVMAQTILALPIVASLTHSAVVSVDPVIREATAALGATPFQVTFKIVREARYGIMAGVIAAFGRVMAEVGAILLVGGNIAGYTRVMTTAIALETDKGNFELAIALGIILLTLSLIINMLLHSLQSRGKAVAGR